MPRRERDRELARRRKRREKRRKLRAKELLKTASAPSKGGEPKKPKKELSPEPLPAASKEPSGSVAESSS